MGLAIDAPVVVGEGGVPVFDPQKMQVSEILKHIAVPQIPLDGFRRVFSSVQGPDCSASGLSTATRRLWTYFKGESASSGSSFPRCSFVLSIIQGADANAYAS